MEKQTGVDYVIKRIDSPQGRGGEIKTQLARIKKLANELKGKGAHVAAIIHTGTVLHGRPGSGDVPSTGDYKRMDQLINEYMSLTKNVTFIGSPPARTDYKGHSDRVKWNDWLKQKLPKHGIKYIETAGITGDKDLRDNVHLSRKGYGKMMSAAIPGINFDGGTGATMAGGPTGAGMPRVAAASGGTFVHGISPIEKFKFDVFYKELDTYFADKGGAEGMLPGHGKDYKFGREHQKAHDALKKAKAAPPAADARVASAGAPTVAAAGAPPTEGECPEGQVAMPDGYCYQESVPAEETELRALGVERYDVNEPGPRHRRGKVKQLKDYSRRLSESKIKQKIKIKFNK